MMLMSVEIVAALIGLGGSAIGSLIGIFINSKRMVVIRRPHTRRGARTLIIFQNTLNER